MDLPPTVPYGPGNADLLVFRHMDNNPAKCPQVHAMVSGDGMPSGFVEILEPRNSLCNQERTPYLDLKETSQSVTPEVVPAPDFPGMCLTKFTVVNEYWYQPATVFSRDFDVFTKDLDLAAWEALVQEYRDVAIDVAEDLLLSAGLDEMGDIGEVIDEAKNVKGMAEGDAGSAVDWVAGELEECGYKAAGKCVTTVKLGVMTFGAALAGSTELFQALGWIESATRQEGVRRIFYGVQYPGWWELVGSPQTIGSFYGKTMFPCEPAAKTGGTVERPSVGTNTAAAER